MTDNLDKTSVLFPHKPKERNTGRIDVNDVAGGLASSSILSYMHRPYANPLITTAAVLKTGGKIMRRARKLRKQLYDSIPYNFVVAIEDMDGSFGKSGSVISFSDTINTMKTINLPGITEGERQSAKNTLSSIMRYLWYPNSMVNDIKYCSNARKVIGLIVSNDIVKEVDHTIYESLTAFDSYLLADSMSGGLSMRNTPIRADVLLSIINGNTSASHEMLTAVQDIEMSLATYIEGKAFWQTDDSGVVYYSVENEAAFLGKALTNSGSERDAVSTMDKGNTNRWIANRMATIRTLVASRYDYNKITHMQMGSLKVYNNAISRLYMSFGVTTHDAVGHNWSNDLNTLLKS